MAGGQERILRRRIKSVQSTKKITRAMELIASSQIVRSQNRIRAGAPYQRGIAEVLAEAAAVAGETAGRVIGVPASPRRILVVAMVADRGLCGGYNANVLRTVERVVRAGRAEGKDYRVIVVGKKAPSYLRFRGIDVSDSFLGFSDRPTFEDARPIAAIATDGFLAEDIDQVFIVSARFLSAGTQVVETRQVLPLPEPGAPDGSELPGVGTEPAPKGEGGIGSARAKRAGYAEFEPDAADLLVDLVPRYVEAAVFGALLEAAASEHTARQRAMAAATDNAEELVKTLTRVMNRARQDAITTEIMEIVGGAEALRQSKGA